MYNPKSLKAEEFIDHQEILDTLEYADKNKDNVEVIDAILEKARLRKGLTHREASVLLACDIPEKIQELYALAEQIKKDFYGNRIVMFAPLYLSNYCVNGCTLLPLPRKKQAHRPQKAHPGGNPPGSHRLAGHGPQAAGPGSRRGPGEQSH